MNTDLRVHSEVSNNFPMLPLAFALRQRGYAKTQRYLAKCDGVIASHSDQAVPCGSWWPHSASCVEINVHGAVHFFQLTQRKNTWESHDREFVLTWLGVRKKPEPTDGNEYHGTMSRFRTSILPLDRLDAIHRVQLACMGLSVCFSAEVGRVLVTAKTFREGEVVIYSRVVSFSVSTDKDVLELFNEGHPSSCYLLVPRLKRLYYNRDTFTDRDPIQSGDMWYLVNHSARPNVEVVLRKSGIQFKAKRTIYPNEPLVWTYPALFFGVNEQPVDLPQYLVPDRGVVSVRE